MPGNFKQKHDGFADGGVVIDNRDSFSAGHEDTDQEGKEIVTDLPIS